MYLVGDDVLVPILVEISWVSSRCEAYILPSPRYELKLSVYHPCLDCSLQTLGLQECELHVDQMLTIRQQLASYNLHTCRYICST